MLEHRPVRIERHAYHIPLTAIGFQFIKKPGIQFVVISIVQMDDDNSIVEDGLYRIVSYIDKSSQVGKVLTVFHFLRSAIGTLYITFPHIIGRTTQCSIFIPKHPRTDFITYLNPLGSNSCRFQRIKYIGSMAGDGFLQVGQVQSFPCSRLMLLSRVGPPVTVMEVYHYIHTQPCGTLGFRHQIGRIAPVIMFFGIEPYSESNRIQAQILHQLKTIGLHTGGIVEFHTLMFHLRHPTDVGTFSKVRSQRFLLIGKSADAGICFITAAACKYGKGNTKKESQEFHVFHGNIIIYCIPQI